MGSPLFSTAAPRWATTKWRRRFSAGRDIACKPFKKHHAEQLKLVSSFDWIDFENLKDVESMITAVLSDEKNGEFIDESRISAIASAAVGRVQTLREIALTHAPNLAEITT